MDQPVHYSGLMATVQNLFDKQSTCNNSLGLFSGIPRPAWLFDSTRKVPDNQPVHTATKEVNNSSDNNSRTTSDQILKSPATTTTRTLHPLPPRPPTASGSRDPASHTDATATAHAPKEADVPACTSKAVVHTPSPLPRPRSISEVQADIKSRIEDNVASQAFRTEPEIYGMPKFFINLQAVPSQTPNVPTGPRKKIIITARERKEERERKKQRAAEVEAERNAEWVTSFHIDHLGTFPNPRFVNPGTQRGNSRIFPNEICKVKHNATFGRRLVLFTDGSGCGATGVASGAAVVYQRFYDLESNDAESSDQGVWEEEAFGMIRGPTNFEVTALVAALGVVHREAEEFFAKPYCEADGIREPLRVYIFVDCRQTINQLQRISTDQVKPKSMHKPFIQQLTEAWSRVQPLLRNGKVRLEIHWVKGHNGAEGNMQADGLALLARLVSERFDRVCRNPLSPGIKRGVFPLEQMFYELSLVYSATKRHESSLQQTNSSTMELEQVDEKKTQKEVAQQDALGQIRPLFTEFFNETRENSEKLNKLAFEELRKELAKLPKESLQQEGTKSQKQDRLASDELRTEISRLFCQQEAQNAQAESMMMALEEATGEWRESLAAQSREIKALRKEGEELLRALREETREAVKTVVQAVTSGVNQTGDKSEGERRSDDSSSNSDSNSDNHGALPIEGAGVMADVMQPEHEVTSCASSGGSRETVRTAFEVAVNRFECHDIEVESHTGIEEEGQKGTTPSTSAEAAEVTGLVTGSGRLDGTTKSCASSGETVFGEIEAQSPGSVMQGDDGKSPGRLRRRERLLRKLHLRWPGRKSGVIADIRS
ncbi:hypothetical protein PG988_001144 [Apiospora saccharicola]